MHSFFLDHDKWPAEDNAPLLLQDAEARHLSKVLRLPPGSLVEVLDGQGRAGRCKVMAFGKKGVELMPVSITRTPRPKRRATLALGYNKALRRSWLLEKAVELDADAMWFWQAERSQGKMPLDAGTARAWHAQLAAGAKQCGNPWLPQIKTLPGGAPELAALRPRFDQALVLWEETSPEDLISSRHLSGENTLFVLGPEGGISRAEMNVFEAAGFSPLSLGTRVLRWETAALLVLGLSWWNRQEAGQKAEGSREPEKL